jgi:hypothetical protein
MQLFNDALDQNEVIMYASLFDKDTLAIRDHLRKMQSEPGH